MNISPLVIPEMELRVSSSQFTQFQPSYLIANTDGFIIKKDERLVFKDIPSDLKDYLSKEIVIGRKGDTSWYISGINPELILPSGYHLTGIRDLYGSVDEDLLGIASRGVQLIRFDSSTRYCGYCGKKTIMKSDEIAKFCSSCNRIIFPRLSPAIIVRITYGDRILLSRSPHFSPGMYSIQAGFVEPGESLEAAVHREVLEEVGIKIRNIRYFASQPWPFPDSLMIGFTAEYDSGSIVSDGIEIEDARWFSHENIPDLPSKISISRILIQDWLDKNTV